VSTDHRKPFVAFVLLAVAAAVLVGTGRADAVAGHLFESMSSVTLRVHGTVPAPGDGAGSGASFDELVAAGGATSRPAGPTRHVAGPVALVRLRRTEPVSRGTERRVLGSARHHGEVSAHGDARRDAHAGRRDDAGHRRPEAREAQGARRAEEKALRSAHKQETAKDKGESRAARGAHPGSPHR
jgi:hypothetical protein